MNHVRSITLVRNQHPLDARDAGAGRELQQKTQLHPHTGDRVADPRRADLNWGGLPELQIPGAPRHGAKAGPQVH